MSATVHDLPDHSASSRRLPGALRWVADRWSAALPLPSVSSSEWPPALRRARNVGLLLLLVQLLAYGWWTALLTSRSALSYDFATHQQAMFLISHGVLDPYSTVQQFWYYQDHGEVLFWLFAPLEFISRSPNVLLWLQDAATIAAEVVAFLWICDLAVDRARKDRAVAMPVALVALGVLLLVANPWTVWSASQDVHTEAFAVLFAILAARALCTARPRLWIYVVLCLATGDVGTTYMSAVAVSGMLYGRYAWRRGAAVLGASLFWFVVLQVTHANHGDIIVQYSNLAGATTGVDHKVTASTIAAGVAEHPWRVISALWTHRLNLWAVVSAAGIIGWLWLPVLIPCGLVVLEADLGSSLQFSAPSFQQVLVGIFAAVGTVGVLSYLWGRVRTRRRSVLIPALMATQIAVAFGWAIVWLPQLSNRWLRTSAPAATVLNQLAAKIGRSDEVVAENGVVGRFADHRNVFTIMTSQESFPIRAKHVWFLLSPYEGIETIQVESELADIAQLLRTPGMRLVAARQGEYAFEWTAPPGVRRFRLNGDSAGHALPAWLATNAAGSIVRSGNPLQWYAASNGQEGYVVARADWQASPGRYDARVSLSVKGSANVEFWYTANGSRLLDRLHITGNHSRTTVTLKGILPPHLLRPPVYNGWGIWDDRNIDALFPQVEVRVWDPGGASQVKVYTVSVRRVQ